MELQLSLLGVFCFISFIFVTLKLRKGSNPNFKLPPGPWKLPLIGNLHQMIGSQPHIALRDLAIKYGDLMYLQLGEIPTLIVTSNDYAKEVMKTHDIVFASRPQLNAAKLITYNFTDIAFSPYGEYWRQLRRICVVELLSMRRVQLLQPIREEEVSKLIKWVYSKSGSTINLTEKIYSSTYSLVARMAFREKVDKEGEFISLIKEGSRLTAGFNAVDLFPSIKLLPFISGVNSDLEKIHIKGSKILGDIIDQHIKSTTTKEEECLVDVLLKYHGSDNEFTLTIDNIKAIIQDMFGAGSDTSSGTVDWAMTEMIKLPRVMKKAKDEVRKVFQSRASADETWISELKHLKLVIKETLRLHPPAPLLLPRENSERCELNGYEIPKKTRVIVNAWAIGRDPRYWGVDAESFYPERFFDNPIDFKGGNFEYIQFGAGRRMCPGMAFGLSNAEYMLSQLLYYFDWKLLIADDLDMTDDFGVTMKRRDDLILIPTSYFPSPLSKS